MKTLLCVLLMCCLLCACGTQATYETVADELAEPVVAQPCQILVDLPDDAIAPVLDTEGEQIYLSQDHEIFIETRSSGDLQATVEALCGYDMDRLTVMQTRKEGLSRYDFVWACAGENGERLGRAVILDDGAYHYCMSVLRDAQGQASQISWEDVFGSFSIAQGTSGTEDGIPQ